MRSSHVCGRTLATSLIAFGIGIGLAVVPTASADPNDTGQADTPAPGPGTAPDPGTAPGPGTLSTNAAPLTADDATTSACKQFAAALSYAAASYEDFAYSTAGTGNYVDYADPNVQYSNVAGRSGLKAAASTAMSASTTPGLSPDISGAMQSWSAHAAQLYLLMAVQGGGDSLNTTAQNLNTEGKNAQMACAAAGVRFR